MGSGQGEIKAVKARECETHDECRGTKENCVGSTEKMGVGEGEESQLTRKHNAATEQLGAMFRVM